MIVSFRVTSASLRDGRDPDARQALADLQAAFSGDRLRRNRLVGWMPVSALKSWLQCRA